MGASVHLAGSGQGAPFYRLRYGKTTGHFHMTNSREVGYAVTHDGHLYESVGANVVS